MGAETEMQVGSVALGVVGLWVALAIAIVLAWARPISALTLRAAIPTALIALTIQAVHFAEEFATGFHAKFFPMLGQQAWSSELFVGFNAAWLAAWSLAIAAAGAERATFLASVLLLFLAIAATANGIAHPALAIAALGYFPGLITAPLLGIAGLVLWRKLKPYLL